MKNRKRNRGTAYALAVALIFSLAAPCAAENSVVEPVAAYVLAESAAYEATGIAAADTVEYYLAFSNQLTPAARDIYDALLAHTETMVDGKSEIKITFRQGITKEIFRFSDYVDAVSAFTRDHSEIFWVDFSNMTLTVYEDPQTKALYATLHAPDGSYYISPYTETAEVQRDRQALANGLARALEEVDPEADTYTQLLQMHDWLCANNTYNDDIASNDMRMFEAVSALDADPNTKPVCEGYARAFKLLCDARGIACVLVAGAAIQHGYAVAHMWNLVFLDDGWYAVDVTWDDALSWGGPPRYHYFLTGAASYANAASFSDSHVPNGVINSGGSEFLYPQLSEAAYVYSPDAGEDWEKSLLPGFEKSGTYTDGLFIDVAPEDWYCGNVALAFSLGLMVGNGDGSFNTDGNISIAECVSIAARIHAAYTGADIPTAKGSLWYEGAVRYALENGILTEAFEDYSVPVSRRLFAQILSCALPPQVLEEVNRIEAGTIPDVAEDSAVYLLYRAGVLRGDEDGSFYPDTQIRRCEVAAIVTRMVVPALRVRFAL